MKETVDQMQFPLDLLMKAFVTKAHVKNLLLKMAPILVEHLHERKNNFDKKTD